MAHAPASESELAQARSLGIETCGRIAAFWGFTRTMGRAFGLLYLSGAPLSRAEIQQRIGISAGNASMTLSGLCKWGVVHKVKQPGRRGDFYQAETDFWKMISRVLNERERREIEAAVHTVSRACDHARSARRHASAAERRDVDFVTDRLQKLQGLSQLGEIMLDMLLGELSLDVGRFRAIFRGELPPPSTSARAADE